MKSRYASPLGVRVPQERLTDLRISLMPSGLANQYYGLIPQQLLPCVRACGAYLRKFSLVIFLIAHSLLPLVGCVLARYFKGEVGKNANNLFMILFL